jgi:hypothetical protein
MCVADVGAIEVIGCRGIDQAMIPICPTECSSCIQSTSSGGSASPSTNGDVILHTGYRKWLSGLAKMTRASSSFCHSSIRRSDDLRPWWGLLVEVRNLLSMSYKSRDGVRSELSPLQAEDSYLIASWHSLFQVDAERAILESGIPF